MVEVPRLIARSDKRPVFLPVRPVQKSHLLFFAHLIKAQFIGGQHTALMAFKTDNRVFGDEFFRKNSSASVFCFSHFN
jgi:hypothetical protein